MKQTMLTLRPLACIWQKLLLCTTSLVKPLSVPLLVLAVTICGNTSGFAQSFFVDSNPTYLNKDVKVTLIESCSDEASEYSILAIIAPPDGSDTIFEDLKFDENNDCWTNSFNASIAGVYSISEYPGDFTCGRNNNHFDAIYLNVSATPFVMNKLVFSQNTTFTGDDGNSVPDSAQYWTPTDKTSALYTQNGRVVPGNVVTKAHLVICAALPSNKNMTLYGTADNGMTFTMPFVFPANQTEYDLENIKSDQTFVNKFDFIGFIDWQLDWDQCEYDVTSDNNIYYAPFGTMSSEYVDTVLYVVCKAMEGKSVSDPNACDAIWSVFKSLNVFGKDRVTPFHYWAYGDDGSRRTMWDLLKSGNKSAQCTAWADFLRHCFYLGNGIAAWDEQDLKPTDGCLNVCITNQEFFAPGYPFGHPPYNYKVPNNVRGHDGSGWSIPCQGLDPAILQSFPSHAIVTGYNHEKTWFWDPSYGKEADTELNLEQQEVDGSNKFFDTPIRNTLLWRKKSENLNVPFFENM